jgi:hypothetical protein
MSEIEAFSDVDAHGIYFLNKDSIYKHPNTGGDMGDPGTELGFLQEKVKLLERIIELEREVGQLKSAPIRYYEYFPQTPYVPYCPSVTWGVRSIGVIT